MGFCGQRCCAQANTRRLDRAIQRQLAAVGAAAGAGGDAGPGPWVRMAFMGPRRSWASWHWKALCAFNAKRGRARGMRTDATHRVWSASCAMICHS